MQLSATAPTPALLLTGVIVNVSTRADGAPHGLQRSERLETSFTPGGPLEASVQVADPLWDGPVAPPVDPRSWSSARPNDATPKLAAAVAGLRDALTGVDLTRVSGETSGAAQYAGVHLRFDQRPSGLDHLRPQQGRDGNWTVYMRTSLDDLFVDPQLAPVVDAARLVIDAAR